MHASMKTRTHLQKELPYGDRQLFSRFYTCLLPPLDLVQFDPIGYSSWDRRRGSKSMRDRANEKVGDSAERRPYYSKGSVLLHPSDPANYCFPPPRSPTA